MLETSETERNTRVLVQKLRKHGNCLMCLILNKFFERLIATNKRLHSLESDLKQVVKLADNLYTGFKNGVLK
jgi:carbamoylphosphate synthase small subunit